MVDILWLKFVESKVSQTDTIVELQHDMLAALHVFPYTSHVTLFATFHPVLQISVVHIQDVTILKRTEGPSAIQVNHTVWAERTS